MTRNEEDELMGKEMQKPINIELALAQAEIKVLKEQNARLSELLNFMINKPTQAQGEFQALLVESKKMRPNGAEKSQ